MNKSGFTLAEVLITLVIIGVIAALTIGTVVSNTSKKQLESQIKKFHAQFANAIQLYMVDNEIDKFSEDGSDFNEEDFVNNYLKVTTKCSNDVGDCFASEYVIIPGNEIADNLIHDGYKLSDGSVFIVDSGNKNNGGPGFVTFDVNGSKKPNKSCQDLWQFYVHVDGSIDGMYLTPDVKKASTASELNDLVNQGYQSNCPENDYASCFAYLIRNDYKIED